MRRWCDNVNEALCARALTRRARTHHSARLARQSFTNFRETARACRRRRFVGRRAVRWMRTHLVSRVFCGWRAEVSEVGTDPGVWTWRPNSAPGTGG
jgi:hypothetical protein